MSDGRLMQSMLLDFYGELLTEKQRRCYDLHVNEDLSLAEIAEQCGISRQGVWDNIRRAEASLMDFEEKTGLIRRFTETRRVLEEVSRRAGRIALLTEGRAHELAGQIVREIEALED